jgi:hypothetical protein
MARVLKLGACALVLGCALAPAAADIVFRNVTDNGFFTPFSSSTAAGVRYGDGGWLSNWTSSNYTLAEIDLGLATWGGTAAGTTDLVFTFNDGDPSGMVYGPGTALYSTVIHNVALPVPAVGETGPVYFDLVVPLPNVLTSGGYNNIGWSVSVQNFDFTGQFGFQCSSAYGQYVGYYTSNASYYNGSAWSLFSFGSDPYYGVANFVATVYTPEPAALALLTLGLMLVRRR